MDACYYRSVVANAPAYGLRPEGGRASPLQQTVHRSAAVLAFALAVAAAGVLRSAAAQSAPAAVETVLDIPPIPGEVARALTFGFRSLLADFTLLQAIQLLPLRHGDMPPEVAAPIDRQLYRLLEYSVEVDPKFAGAYRFAAAALPHETLDGKVYGVLHALRILEKGLRERPDEWQMGFLLGFLQSYYLHDFVAAARSFAASASLPRTPSWVGLLATRLAAQGGELQIATSLAEAMLVHANEEGTRKEWRERVDALHMERDLRAIEEAAQRYREARGVQARSVQALVAAGLLPAMPEEPHGGRYVLEGDGTARSTAAERLHAYGLDMRFEIH
jgi:hypothetical protein